MYIGIDLGGTNIRAALVDHGEIIRKVSTACPAQESQEVVTEALCALIGELMNGQVTGIGAGIPSVLDREKGIVYNVANIPSWQEVHLKEILEQRFHVRVMLNNDSNCFTLGVSTCGEGKAFADMVGITLGTGVGAGVIVGHKLYNGKNTGAGEIGSLPYLDSDYEHYCSSTFFPKFYGKSGKELAEAALQNDAEALQAWDEFGRHMGNLIKAVMFCYDPEAVVLGGSIAKAFSFFKDSMWACIQEFPYPASTAQLKVLPSALEDAALLGAAMLCEE